MKRICIAAAAGLALTGWTPAIAQFNPGSVDDAMVLLRPLLEEGQGYVAEHQVGNTLEKRLRVETPPRATHYPGVCEMDVLEVRTELPRDGVTSDRAAVRNVEVVRSFRVIRAVPYKQAWDRDKLDAECFQASLADGNFRPEWSDDYFRAEHAEVAHIAGLVVADLSRQLDGRGIRDTHIKCERSRCPSGKELKASLKLSAIQGVSRDHHCPQAFDCFDVSLGAPDEGGEYASWWVLKFEIGDDAFGDLSRVRNVRFLPQARYIHSDLH